MYFQFFSPKSGSCGGCSWWLSGKKSAHHAGNTSSVPGPGRSHMPWNNKACVPQLLRLHALKPVCHQRKDCSEKLVHCHQSSPCSLQLEKAHTQQRRPSVVPPKINFRNKELTEWQRKVPHKIIKFPLKGLLIIRVFFFFFNPLNK